MLTVTSRARKSPTELHGYPLFTFERLFLLIDMGCLVNRAIKKVFTALIGVVLSEVVASRHEI